MAHDRSESMLVFFPRPQAVGEIPKWPLHMTVLPWTKLSPEELVDFTNDNVQPEDIMAVEIGEAAMFGHPELGEALVEVKLVEPADRLCNFHTKFFRPLEQLILSDRRDSGENYRPHITRKEGQRNVKKGDKFTFDSVSIVSWVDGKRTVVANVRFEKSTPS